MSATERRPAVSMSDRIISVQNQLSAI